MTGKDVSSLYDEIHSLSWIFAFYVFNNIGISREIAAVVGFFPYLEFDVSISENVMEKFFTVFLVSL